MFNPMTMELLGLPGVGVRWHVASLDQMQTGMAGGRGSFLAHSAGCGWNFAGTGRWTRWLFASR